MVTPAANANGHRRRELRARVFAEETHCALCGGRVDKNLRYTPGMHSKRCPGGGCAGCSPHPMSPVVDENIPRSRGGSPYERENTSLMHRSCNGWKGAMTLTEARAKQARDASAQTERVVVNLIKW